MWTGGFPEPLTFSLRALRGCCSAGGRLRRRPRQPGARLRACSGIARLGLPLVTSIHHPITVDRRIDLDAAPTACAEARPSAAGTASSGCRRGWPAGCRAGRSPSRSPPAPTSSARLPASARRSMHIIPLGVDTRVFHPATAPRVPGRIVAVASADSPLKGSRRCCEAVAKLRTERDVQLVVVSKPDPGRPHRAGWSTELVARRPRHVRLTGISDDELAEPAGQRGDRRGARRSTRASRCPPSSTWPRARRWSPAAPARCPRSSGDAGDPGRRRATSRSWPPPSAGCTTPRAERERVAAGRLSGSRSGSPGAPSRRDGRPPDAQSPGPCHRRRPQRRSAALLTVDFDRLRSAPGRPGPRHGLRRRPARVRGSTAAAPTSSPSTGRARSWPPSRACSAAMRAAGEVPAGRRGADVSRATPSACRSPTARSTGSSPPRCSSTSRTTRRPWPSWPRVLRPGGTAGRHRARAGCRSGSAGRCRTTTTTSRGRPRPDLHPRRAGGQAARGPASRIDGHHHAHGLHAPVLVAQVRGRRGPTTTTRWRRPTTRCWSGTS